VKNELRLEVQALRAVAVLMVVLYHLWPGRLPGGYVGVDVFFVISGFLITAHLLREVESTGRVRLARFWARRARRLLPAAYVVLLSSAIAVYVWVPQIAWAQNFREIVGSALYAQNWVLASDAVDYLASDNAPSVAQHFWTLSVEEQFYLVWPVLVVAAVALAGLTSRISSRRALTLVLGGVTLASLAYSLYLTDHNPAAAYFVTPTRAWEFGAGALLALWTTRRAPGTRGARREPGTSMALVSWGGLLALAWCAFAFSSSTAFPGVAALLPVAATMAVIVAGTPSGPVSPAPLIRLRPVQVLGDISYSMYLWHWAPIVVLPFVLGHELGLWSRIGILAGTIALSVLTKRYVEDPVRVAGSFGLRRSGVTFALAGVAATALVTTSLVGSSIAGAAADRAEAVTKRLNANQPACFGAAAMDPDHPCTNPDLVGTLVPAPEAAGREEDDAYPGCFAGPGTPDLSTDCSFGDVSDTSLPHVVLVGDSHLRSYLPIFVELAKNRQITLTAQLKSSCAWTSIPLEDEDTLRVESCTTWRHKLARWLEAQAPSIDLVVTTGRAKYQSGSHAARVKAFSATWSSMGRKGIPVLALRDNPDPGRDPNTCLAQTRPITPDSCSFTRAHGLRFDDAMPDAARVTDNGASIDLTDFYCRGGTCPAVIGGVNVYRDTSHPTFTFMRTLAPYLYQRMVALDLLEPRTG
jgi:peptidoglycan/LPS O-acetylase OafA/YrhL